MTRRRLDSEMVRRHLVADIDAARSLIEDDRVVVDGAPSNNPARLVGRGEAIRLLRASRRHVGRGGEKFEGAIQALDLDLGGHRVLDVGASTGGFTDAALQHGAASVLALDVGRGQLHDRLRRDPRVTTLDRTNIRLTDPAELGHFDSVVADLSFISLSTVMENLVACTRPGGQLVLLVKPQFEVSAQDASHNRGVIRERALWKEALERTAMAGLRHGAQIEGMCVSPITGAEGNVEFFVQFRRHPREVSPNADGLVVDQTGPHGGELAHAQVPEDVHRMISTVVAPLQVPARGGL